MEGNNMERFVYVGNDVTAKSCFFRKTKYSNSNNFRLDMFGYVDGNLSSIKNVTIDLQKELPEDLIAVNYRNDDMFLLEMKRIGLFKNLNDVIVRNDLAIPIFEINTDVLQKYVQA